MARNTKKSSEIKGGETNKLDRGDIILLEEYKNCTQVLMNENRIAWKRFSVFLSLSSALITAWTSFSNLNFLTGFGQLLIGLIGLLVALTWLFVTWKAHSYNDLWADRLEDIEKALSGIPKTFNDKRETEFLKMRPLWQKKPTLTNLRPFVPYMFSFFWLTLLVNTIFPMQLDNALVKEPLSVLFWIAVLILVPPFFATIIAKKKEKKK